MAFWLLLFCIMIGFFGNWGLAFLLFAIGVLITTR